MAETARLHRNTGSFFLIPNQLSARRRMAFLMATTALLGLSAAPAAAQTWEGTVNPNWHLGSNWDNNAVPNAASDVVISDTTLNESIIALANADTASLTVGGPANASLRMTSGQTLTVGGLSFLGFGVGEEGIVTLDNSAQWIANDTVVIGLDGIGRLNVSGNSDAFLGGAAVLGVGEQAQGFALVDGAGSQLVIGGALAIGGGGKGELHLTGGSLVSSSEGMIGTFAGSEGVVTIADNSIWNMIGGELFIGLEGRGSLHLSTGGDVVSGAAIIGAAEGSFGHAQVEGLGSSWLVDGVLGVGAAGEGMLGITDNSTVTVTGDAVLGAGSTGTAEATVEGGAIWSVGGDFYAGVEGQAAVTVQTGGTMSSANAFLGVLQGSTGRVVVDGPGSGWTNAGTMDLGISGKADLMIANGAGVTNTEASIGVESGGSGAVTVDNATWINSGQLLVGEFGEAALTIRNGATVSNAGAYVGRHTGSSGAVMVDNATWTNNVFLTVGRDGDGSLQIVNGGTVTSPSVIVGYEASSNSSVTISGAGSSLQTNGDLTIGIWGSAALHVGADATASAGLEVFAGGVTGANARVVVDGTLSAGGSATFNSGSHLSGTGTVITGGTGTIINGVIAPGNSIGTLSIVGNYVQNTGSTYEVEIDAAGNSDLIDISGTATLNGGEVVVVPFPDFAIATPYTILTAAGGVSGQFDALAPFSYFLSPELSYDPNTVFLTIQQSASFESAAMTPNQIATAQGADSLPTNNPVWTAIAMLPDAPTAQFAFDQLSGEVHGSVQSALIDDSRFVRDAALNRIRDAFAGVGASNAPVLAYGEGGPELVAPDTDRFAVWANGFGSWGHWDSDGNAAQLDRSIGGLFVGGDLPVGDWRIGALAGYAHSSLDVDARASSASVESWHLGLYGGTQWGDLAFRTGAAYSWHDVSTARTAAFPGFADSLTGDYDARTGQIFGELAYGMDFGAYRFEPFANLAYVHQSRSGFAEQGGAAALTAASASTNTTFTTLGLRGATEVDLGGATTMTAHATLGWRHAFGDVTPTSTHAFAGGVPFTIAGTPIARDAAVIEAGLDFRFSPQASFGISYSGQLAGNAQSHGISAKLGVSF